MVRMAEELQDEGDQEAVSFELPAPVGWKKFISKKAGTPKRNEIAFISPTGEEIRYKKHLDQYLRSHPGGPSSSEFDWGYGDTPRRSARLSEKAKEIETPEEEPSKKQGALSSSKKGTKKKKEDRDSDAEDYSPEAKRPKKREKHSTPKKGTKPKTKSVDAGIRGVEPEKDTLGTKAPESVEDSEMKSAEDAPIEEKEASSAKVISEDSSAKVDSKDECKYEDGVVAEVEHKVSVSIKIATEELEIVEELDVKDSEVGSIKGIETAKLDSDDGAKLKNHDFDADIVDVARESEKFVTQALESVEVLDTKDVTKVGSNDYVDAEMKDEAPINENIATHALNNAGDSVSKIVAKLDSINDLDAEMNDGVPKTEQIATQALMCAEDSDTKNVAKVDSNDGVDSEAKNEGLESENIAMEAIKSAKDSGTKLVTEVNDEKPESEKMATEVLKEPFDEDLHGVDEDEDKALLKENHKGEQVPPSKAIPNASCRDLKSPEKAAAIV